MWKTTAKGQAEDHSSAMTAPLASDSLPDNGKSMGSPQGTMKPTARLPFDHTCDLSMNNTLLFPILFLSSHLIVWLHGYDTPPERFPLLHRLIRTNTTTTFFDLLLCTEQHAEPAPMYHSISPPEQQHAQWCLRSSSRKPASLTSMASTKSESPLPIIFSFSVVASKLTTPDPSFSSFALSWCEEGTPLPDYFQTCGRKPRQARLHSNCDILDL